MIAVIQKFNRALERELAPDSGLDHPNQHVG